MQPHEISPDIAAKTTPTLSAILARIESEQLQPTPRYTFLLREWSVWGLWGLTVAVGALAVAVTMYEAMSIQYALYEATHHNFGTFVVDALPYVWVFILLLMTLAAVPGIRHTKRGYRYGAVTIIGSSLLCSFGGGAFLHVLGMGYVLDTVLGQQINRYQSMEKMELAQWQSPEQGRLIGMLVAPRADTPETDLDVVPGLQFQDQSGVLWLITDSELTAREMALLSSERRVRLLGTSTSPGNFHICGVFPWMYDHAMPWADMKQQREQFESRMRAHKQMMQDTLRTPDSYPSPIPTNQLCAHLEMMGRMR